MEALPAGSMEVSAGYNNKENHTGSMHAQQERILSWTAAQVAGTTAQEATIQPTQRQHPYYAGDYGRIRVGVGAGGHASPKPPRPTSPPTLSPLDYQPYHSEDGLSQSDIVQRRINLVQAMTPPGSDLNAQVRGSPVVARSPGSQVSGVNRPYTTSLDRRQQADLDYRGSPNVRRAQTLRTDYASRLRERVLSLRVEPGEAQGEGGTLRPRKPRTKKETYVCSDTIKFPKLSFKLGRRQKEKSPAVVRPEKVDMVIPRPQPNFVSSAPPDDQQRFWMQQQITNDYELGVCGTEGYGAKWFYPKPGPQVTSLPSMAGRRYEHEKPQVISPDSTAQEYDLTTVSYISGEIRGQLEQPTEMEQLQEALKMTQPFLVSWDARESENRPRDSSPEALAQTVDCIRSFLNTCIRIRSADLQGHFAPFQYQLASFAPRCWKNVAKFSKWNNILVVGGAPGTTEYLQMVPPPLTKPELFYARRCVDIMLTNWLDRHHSTPQLVEGCRDQVSQASYQPISFVSNLAKLVDVNPFANTSMNALFQLGMRLAVLLTYESCLTEVCSETSTHSLKPVTKLEEIVLGWSTCNCITLFRLEEKPNEPAAPSPPPPATTTTPKEETPMEEEETNKEDGTGSDIDMPVAEPKQPTEESPAVDDLVKSLCPEYTSVENAIDGLIDKLYQTVTEQLNPAGIGSCLLKSVAPPDWVAMLVSRIAMHKI